MKAKSGKQIIEISKDVETEVMSVHNLFWESYASRDIELRFSLCTEDVTFIGSGLHERALNKTEYKNINKEGVKQYPDPFQIEFLWTNIAMLSENVACVESEVVWSQLINDEMFKELLRNTTLLKRDNSKWLVTHVHGSVPDYRLKDGDYMTNEQTIIRNRELERQVFERTQDLNKTLEELGQKNRELEIEGALEKVRTIAMGMRKPDDMLDVCKTISLQLQSLGVKEIRNVQTAIFYEQRGTYMNYEFYAKHDKTFITETVYTNNKIHNEFATKMLRGKGETFITHIKGDEVKNWVAYQKTTNVFIDKYLETASSLNYYWFSLGPVALGISTYIRLAEDEINLLKRFLKVFELAYQRYLDIEKAEAQAREAKIEAALEKVRSSALAMKEPEEMVNVCNVISDQLQLLGIKDIRNVQTAIINEQKVTYLNYQYFAAYKEGVIEETDFNKHPTVFAMVEEMKKSANSSFSGSMEGTELITFREWRKQNNQFPDPILDEVDSAYYYFYSIGLGGLGLTTYKPLPEEGLDIFKRFHNVFTLAYRRFIDIEKAIAQAREAKIEAALEKVRGRAMAMRSSEDLGATVNVFFKELKNLGFLPRRCGVAIIDEARRSAYNMITTAGNIGDSFEITGDVNLDSHFVLTNMLLNWKVQQDYFLELDTEQIEEYYRILRPQVAVTNFNDARQYGYYLHFKEGMFYVWMDKELQVNDLQIFRRFTQVIGLTYRRHLDLQKAETQAREAQIEAALERIRAKAMSMHHSDELDEVLAVLCEQFDILGVFPMSTHMTVLDIEHNKFTFRETGKFGNRSFGEQTVALDAMDTWKDMVESWKNAEPYSINSLHFPKETLPKVWEVFHESFASMPEGSKITPNDYPDGIYHTAGKHPFGYIGMNQVRPATAEEEQIVIKFANEFGRAYQRFLDLKKAEAQAREAQIEAALERVRSRSIGMQKSEELKDVIRVVYEQFVHLKINVDHAGFVVDYTPKGDWHFWIADEQDIPSKITHPYFESVWASQFNEAKEKGADFFATNLNFEEKNKFYTELLSYISGLPETSKDFYLSCPGLAATTVLLENVSLYIENFSGIPYTDEENNMLMRFGKVFQQTYTRFLDLEKAETQAREAQIEASLERVRSKALAMHSPNDLSETVNVFFKELKILGIIPIRCGVGQIDKATRTTNLTTTTSSQQGDSFQVIGKVKQTGHPLLDGIFDHWELQKEYHPVLEGDDIKAYYNVMNAQIGYPEYPEEVTQYGNNFFFKEGFVFAWTENLLSEEELIIFRRFTLVLSLTYRRYLDLKEAEERNKIIQAENERKTKELEEARQLQLAMLPKSIPEIPNLDIAVYMKTATEVGGDYYDFKVQENGVLNIGIGDATGHGLQAGTMITLMKGFFTSDVARFSPQKFLEHCNVMIRDIKLGRILMSFSHLRFNNNHLSISSAGMPPIYYHHKKNNRTEEIIIQGLPLGAMGTASYKLVEKQLNSGDTILLLTDGLPEQMNSHTVIFDYSRVLKYFDEIAENTPNDIINLLVQKANEWMDGTAQADDITFVVIKVK